MQAMVLAAGFGTRLRPLTEMLPKPAVPVANMPALAFSIGHLARAGVNHIVINTHYLPAEIEASLSGFVPSGLRLSFVHEEALLGTGGGLANAWHLFDDSPVIVMNSDIVYGPDIQALLLCHREHDAVATMSLRSDPKAKAYGSVELDPEGRVRKLLGRPESISSERLTPLMFAGVHVLSPRAREFLPDEGCIVRKCYMPWVEGGARVAGVIEASPWHDLGSVQLYFETCLRLASGEIQWPGLTPDATRGLIHPSASIDASASVEACIIGRGCQVGPGIKLERCILWPETHASQSASDVILTPRGPIDPQSPKA